MEKTQPGWRVLGEPKRTSWLSLPAAVIAPLSKLEQRMKERRSRFSLGQFETKITRLKRAGLAREENEFQGTYFP